MPIYTYRCENCAVQFERRQSFNDEPLTVCPECHQNQLRKVITPAGIVFKGSGWYVTDHKSKSSAVQPASAKTGTENKAEGKSEGKNEGKDAAPVTSTASTADSGSGSSSGSDSSASKSASSAAKSSSGG